MLLFRLEIFKRYFIYRLSQSYRLAWETSRMYFFPRSTTLAKRNTVVVRCNRSHAKTRLRRRVVSNVPRQYRPGHKTLLENHNISRFMPWQFHFISTERRPSPVFPRRGQHRVIDCVHKTTMSTISAQPVHLWKQHSPLIGTPVLLGTKLIPKPSTMQFGVRTSSPRTCCY